MIFLTVKIQSLWRRKDKKLWLPRLEPPERPTSVAAQTYTPGPNPIELERECSKCDPEMLQNQVHKTNLGQLKFPPS